jgi:hypothetical protein
MTGAGKRQEMVVSHRECRPTKIDHPVYVQIVPCPSKMSMTKEEEDDNKSS